MPRHKKLKKEVIGHPNMFEVKDDKIDSSTKQSTQVKKGKNETKKTLNQSEESLPSGSHAMAAIGPETEKIIYQYYKLPKESTLFNKTPLQEGFIRLAETFKASAWTDPNVANLISKIAEAELKGEQYDLNSFHKWVLSHINDVSGVLDCMSILPPDDITIIKVLPKTGSQKMVFWAIWKLTNKQVVLKKFSGIPEETEKLWGREALSHPFSVDHPNIIETHKLHNKRGEAFLVEEKLPKVLNDRSASHGILEAANLLYDIANALNHLHEIKDLVHGDVKPDNIGMKNYDYILLDFGICRKSGSFKITSTPTGSLRTRAPELLLGEGYIIPTKVDVWALGATVYNFCCGRFPLYDVGESPPRIDEDPEGRRKFELELKERIDKQYDKYVDLNKIDEPLRKVLKEALYKNPEQRCSAKKLMELASKELAAFIRSSSKDRVFSPINEIDQLHKFLPSKEILQFMPISKKQSLLQHLEDILKYEGVEEAQKTMINNLIEKVK
jgi:serine/threonine protein kinase